MANQWTITTVDILATVSVRELVLTVVDVVLTCVAGCLPGAAGCYVCGHLPRELLLLLALQPAARGCPQRGFYCRSVMVVVALSLIGVSEVQIVTVKSLPE